MIFFVTLSIIALNILSGYFWIWLFKELFKRNIKLSDIVIYGITSTASSRLAIKNLNIHSIITKVTIEEATKTATTIVAQRRAQGPSMQSDYIAHAIICGVAFAIIENIIYVYYTRNNNDILSIGVARIISNTVVHSLFTGIIGFGAYKFLQDPKIIRIYRIAITVIASIGGHWIYNRSLISSHLVISIIFIIGGYYILAYLLYKSDRLFIDNTDLYHVDGKM